MVRNRLVMTTWDWRSPVRKSPLYKKNSTNPYGPVYTRVVSHLERDGWTVEPMFTHPDLVRLADSPDYQKQFLEESVRATRERQPGLVLHDNYSAYHQLWFKNRDRYPGKGGRQLNEQTNGMSSEIRRQLFHGFRGNVERVFSMGNRAWDDEVSSKDRFYYAARRLGIPTPETIVLSDIDYRRLDYKTLARSLTGSPRGRIILKLVNSSGGKGIYPVASRGEFAHFLKHEGDNAEFSVAQRDIDLPTPWPYSIRVVTWADKILGGILLINKEHPYCSNSHQGALAFDLALSGQNPRTDTRVLDALGPGEEDIVRRTARYCDIDIEERVLPPEVEQTAIKIGRFGSNALLRGNDFMYDRDGTPLAIESNMHPGPPGTGMFADTKGVNTKDEKTEARFAAQMIYDAIAA
ncbi:RimK family alpha-L-glutamate ligase [Candidatus Aenigmatarchaeota archaeon]